MMPQFFMSATLVGPHRITHLVSRCLTTTKTYRFTAKYGRNMCLFTLNQLIFFILNLMHCACIKFPCLNKKGFEQSTKIHFNILFKESTTLLNSKPILNAVTLFCVLFFHFKISSLESYYSGTVCPSCHSKSDES